MSVDIEDFFPSTTHDKVQHALRQLGYYDEFSLSAITSLTCYGYGLAQGAPSSPIISNVVMKELDEKLHKLATINDCIFTRYADDIVFSGSNNSPDMMLEEVSKLVLSDGWKLSENKKRADRLPNRLKVHGLLVHGEQLRLTKGYRNRLRAYRHLLSKGKVRASDIAKVNGHLEYAKSVEWMAEKAADDKA